MSEPLTFGSLFAGIGGFDLGFERANMVCSWQVEIDTNCLGVLKRHWPSVPKLRDARECGATNLVRVDVMCGGFPCQDLSVAGPRAGLAGERSGLWFQMCRIFRELRPRWVVVENVPGLLSSHDGEDFATVLRGLVECGYSVCWRVLDARGFGVPQRRQRVFIVGSLGSGRCAEVLLEPAGVSQMETPWLPWHGCLSRGNGGKLNFDGSCTLIQDEKGYRITTVDEWERISGFPAGWTAGQSDRARQNQMGNTVVPQMAEWIGRRIVAADGALRQEQGGGVREA